MVIWVIAGAGLILTFAAFFLGRQSAARSDGERWGRLEAMIARQGIDFEKLDEKLDKWILAHIHAFEYMGGVPRVVVPDNLKSAVTKPNHYDPKVNPAYWELAKHYNIGVIPARVREPRDKASVESGVGWLETWLLEWLRGKQFFSFAELNTAIAMRLQELVKRPFQKRPGNRESVFLQVDKPALRALPATRFENADYVTRRVPSNYHIEYDGFYYSVPHTMYKQQVTVRATSEKVEIISDNRERVRPSRPWFLHP